MNYFNNKTLKRLQEVIEPYLKTKGDGKKELEKKVGETLTTERAIFTLVGELRGHIKLKNDKEQDYLILGLTEGEEKIHVYEDKLKRPTAGKELLDSKYRKRIVYLDFYKLYKLKILSDIRYEDGLK